MPLVRISLLRGKPEGFGRKVGDVVSWGHLGETQEFHYLKNKLA